MSLSDAVFSKRRRLLVVTALLGMTGAVMLVAPASAHTCGDVWCSGSDTSTANNIQGNNPQVYVGEIGLYYVDFGTGSGPCPNSPHDACFSTSGANGAQTVWNNGNGIGTQFYYFGGGAASQYASQFGSPYCFGWHQGNKAVANASNSFSSYISTAWLMFIDVEQNATFGWSNQYPQSNRDVLNGFRDFVIGAPSADQGNCPNGNNGVPYEAAVYSAPAQWSYSFGSYGDLYHRPEWTYDDCCNNIWPGDFHYSDSFDAKWFGGSTNNDYHDVWQFDQSPDHLILEEPVYLPSFGFWLGS
jgi:hypothetical protein